MIFDIDKFNHIIFKELKTNSILKRKYSHIHLKLYYSYHKEITGILFLYLQIINTLDYQFITLHICYLYLYRICFYIAMDTIKIINKDHCHIKKENYKNVSLLYDIIYTNYNNIDLNQSSIYNQ